MESGSTIPPKKKLQMANAGEGDIISSRLPESLISHILSFLPTKDAVRTCVLSKTWIKRWTFITKLDIDDSVFCNYSPVCSVCQSLCTIFFYVCDKYDFTLCSGCYIRGRYRTGVSFSDFRRVVIGEETKRKTTKGGKKQCLVNFVNRALLLTSNNSISMERFSFVIRNKHDVSLLNTWISNILNRRVKNLRIHSSFFELPFSALTSHYLFNSTLLEELELVLRMFSTIKVPTISVHFEHLKILNLSGIFFNIDPSGDDLTFSLPVLRKIEIKNCSWSNGKDVIVEAPLLESVSIEQELFYNKLISHDSIKFNALHLKEFTYCGYGIPHQIHLSDRNFLASASTKIILKQYKNKVSQTRRLAFHLLQQFYQVKCIKFEGLEVLTRLKVSTLPVLAKLSHLELGLVTIEVLLGLLKKSPVLQTLVLKEISKFANELQNSVVVPDCLASTLQIVKFEKVNGDNHELFLAKFFMKNGMILEKMGFSIASQSLDKSKVMEEFKEKLYSFKKDFSFAIVELSFD